MSAPTEKGIRMGATRLGIDPYEYRQQIEAGNRWCSGHKRFEPLYDEQTGAHRFYQHPLRATGLDSRCIEYARWYAREYQRKQRAVS